MFFFVIRPDGEKKAYVKLAQDYDALDVANKVMSFVIFVNYSKVLSCSISEHFKPHFSLIYVQVVR